jgi:SulP family sulfate permease
MVKLRNYCEQHGVVLVLCCLSEQLQRAIAGSASPLMREPHRLFTGRNEALEWCEDRLLHEWEIEGIRSGSFEEWLARELKECERHDRIFGFMERRHLAEGTVLYRQGDPAESIDLVVSGRVAITVSEQGGRPVHLRSMADHTVVGEMGFFRKRPRTATVSAQTDAVVYTMTRASLERMLREEPALAGHFLQFIIRTLADRVEFANREIGALL